MYDRMRSIVQSGQRIVDLGCGSGQLLIYVGEKFEERIGIDASQQRLDDGVSSKSESWSFREADLNKRFPLEDESVDAVISNQVIEHIADPVKFVTEIYRVLGPQGRCVITTPNIRYFVTTHPYANKNN